MCVEGIFQREDVRALRHHVAHAFFAEFDDATDDRDLLPLADALELSFAQQVVQRLALDIHGRSTALSLARRRGASPQPDDRRDSELHESKNWHDHGYEV